MPVHCFTHEITLESELKALRSSAVEKAIFEKFEQLSFSIDQKIIAARYFLGCLEGFDFVKLNEAISSSDQSRLIEHTISFSIPVVYCDVSLYAKAKPAYQFLLNLLVDGILANLVSITDILGKVIAELYGFSNQASAEYLWKVRDYMKSTHSSSPVSIYLGNNYPTKGADQFHWLSILKNIRNEIEHQDVCDIGFIRAEQLFGGYSSNIANQVKLFLNTRFFKSGTLEDERDVLKFTKEAENSISIFIDDIYRLLAQEVNQNGVPL